MTDDDERIIEEVAKCVAAKEPLWEVARRIGWPWSKLARWIFEDAERCAAYSAFLRVRADELVFEAMAYKNDAIEISDDATPDDVAVAALRGNMRFKGAELNFKVAGKWDRERYGETQVRIGINAGGGSLVQILSGMPIYEQNMLTVVPEPAAIEHKPDLPAILAVPVQTTNGAMPVASQQEAAAPLGMSGADETAATISSPKKRGRPAKPKVIDTEPPKPAPWI